MSINLTLNCLVFGENPHENAFPIVVNTSEVNTVGLLKELIKEKQPRTFANVDSKELKLWKVDIPLNKLSIVSVSNKDEFLGVKQLSPLDEISENFANQPSQKHIHLIIQQEREFGANQTEFGVNQEDSSKMNSAQAKSHHNSNENNQCKSGFSIATISLQSMVSTTTSLPLPSSKIPPSLFSRLYEKIKNLLLNKEDVKAENEDDIMKDFSVSESPESKPVTNANGTNLCETRFSIVNYCQQYMVNTTTGK